MTEVSNSRENIILTVLIWGIHPDMEEWLSRKPPSTLHRFYNKAAQYLHKEEALRTGKGERIGHQDERIQSNIAVKQSGESFGNIAVNVYKKSND